jgi:hypothetical protein
VAGVPDTRDWIWAEYMPGAAVTGALLPTKSYAKTHEGAAFLKVAEGCVKTDMPVTEKGSTEVAPNAPAAAYSTKYVEVVVHCVGATR